MSMPLPDVVLRIERLAGAKPVQVFDKGVRFDLPLPLPEAPQPKPDPIVAAAEKIAESQREIAAAFLELNREIIDQVGEHGIQLSQEFGDMKQLAATITAAIEENTRTLHLPVRPIKDASGKVVGAKRDNSR